MNQRGEQESDVVLTAPLGERGERSQPGRVSLVLYHRDGARVVPLRPGHGVVVGRDQVVDVPIRESSLSRQHARFELTDDGIWVEDLGSTNGTLVDGLRVERSKLGPQSEISMGAVTAFVHTLAPDERRLFALESHDRFLALAEDELQRARVFGRPFAVLVARTAPPDEQGIARWCRRMRQALRAVDRLALYAKDTVELLLPETGSEEARRLATELAGLRAKHGVAAPLRVGVAVYPGMAASVEELVEVSHAAARRATAAEPIALGAPRAVASPGVTLEQRIVCSPAMRALYDSLDRIAQAQLPVLICGETGTGKELVAQEIHRRGPRSQRPLCCVNCGAIPAALVPSTLFGHERGAFTGADQQVRGVFEEADGGTILLDEIGELPLSAQTTLLRALETKRVTRVGSSKEIPVDLRILAATNCDLEAMSDRGEFRRDLLYRLNALTVKIPPLRERHEEIVPLAELFLGQAAAGSGREPRRIDAAAQEMLRRSPWPGNVRELRNAIERAAVLATHEMITIEDLPERVRSLDRRDLESSLGEEQDLDFKRAMSRHEARLIAEALHRSGWDRSCAAGLLHMPTRTLRHKIRLHGLSRLGPGSDPDQE